MSFIPGVQMKKPVISVIIPVYNRPAKVIRAIQSVLDQSFSDFEIIVVDDGSKPALDLPEKIATQDRVSIVRLDQNKGPSAARNAGARVAQGEWLAWLDSDDIWYREKLSLQMSFLDNLGAEQELMALATGFEYSHLVGLPDKRIPVSSSDPLYFFAGCWFCPGSTVMLRRTLFEKIGPYDETMLRLEDVDWFIRLALAGGRLDVLSQILTTISAGPKPDYQKARRAGDRILIKYKDSSFELAKPTINNLVSYLHIEYASSAIKRERRFSGARFISPLHS